MNESISERLNYVLLSYLEYIFSGIMEYGRSSNRILVDKSNRGVCLSSVLWHTCLSGWWDMGVGGKVICGIVE